MIKNIKNSPENNDTILNEAPGINQAPSSLVIIYSSVDDNHDKESASTIFRMIPDEMLEKVFDETNESSDVKTLRQECGSIPKLIGDISTLPCNLEKNFMDLFAFYVEIEHKRVNLIERNTFFRDQLNTLSDSNSISFNKSALDENEASINHYISLIDKLITEIKEEISLFSLMNRCNKIYIASADDAINPKNALVALEDKVKSIKRYVKNIRQDVNISYSRYSFGLDEQIKQLSYVKISMDRKPQ